MTAPTPAMVEAVERELRIADEQGDDPTNRVPQIIAAVLDNLPRAAIADALRESPPCSYDDLADLVVAAIRREALGPWHIAEGPSQVRTATYLLCELPGDDAAAFIAAAHPQRVIEIIDALVSARAALGDLAAAEKLYRHEHDHYGSGDIRTGQAWDKMRCSGDRARAHLGGQARKEG